MAAIIEQVENLTVQETASIENLKSPIVQELEVGGSETGGIKTHDEYAGFHSSSDSELDVFFRLASGVSELHTKA